MHAYMYTCIQTYTYCMACNCLALCMSISYVARMLMYADVC